MDENLPDLEDAFIREKQRAVFDLKNKLEKQPLLIVRDKITKTLSRLRDARKELKKEWEIGLGELSWWNQIMAPMPDFSEIDKHIADLKSMKLEFNEIYGRDVDEIQRFYHQKELLVSRRIDEAYRKSRQMLDENKDLPGTGDQQLRYGMWGSIFGISASLARDLYQAHGLYDALRGVHGGFSGMSDAQIWWETLWMEPEKLAGLASLAKGAYFEKLVADDTGGKLFAHFNRKDTDIIIDGEAIQLKATDNANYIESVNEDITVMATTEVADRTDAIDSGISNLQISETASLALGGTVVDLGDGIIDGILGGLAGLGTFSTIRGFNHAAEKFNSGGDGAEAAAEGIGIAVKGTAKGLVDTSEVLYNAATSKTGRFMGKTAIKAGSATCRLLDKILSKIF